MEAFALLLARLTLGLFFVSYRFRWFYDPTPQDGGPQICNPHRHLSLRRKLCQCGWGISPGMGAFVAIVEMLAGLGIIFGFLTSLSALGLIAILFVATACTARAKTLAQNPVDRVDVFSCYLWTPEPLYIVLAVVVLALGPGWISLDYVWEIMR